MASHRERCHHVNSFIVGFSRAGRCGDWLFLQQTDHAACTCCGAKKHCSGHHGVPHGRDDPGYGASSQDHQGPSFRLPLRSVQPRTSLAEGFLTVGRVELPTSRGNSESWSKSYMLDETIAPGVSIMKTLMMFVLCIMLSRVASAQSLCTRAGHDPRQAQEIERAWMNGLFQGIELSQQQDSALGKIVRGSIAKCAAVNESSPGYRSVIAVILQQRDEQILSQLKSEHDRNRFFGNARRPIFVIDVSQQPR